MTSDAFAPEKTRTMRAFGAEVIVVPGEGGQVTPDLFGASVDVFCAAVGTAGMISGVSAVLRQAGSRARVVALEPSSSPVLTAGTAGPHRVEGIATGIVPPLLTADVLDEARTVDEAEARRMALRLAREEGILAGTSSALYVVGAIGLALELGEPPAEPEAN
ncbi:pyridoxal-phosphate dependent enzyme [Streptomyces diastatochromogenes]|uniref:pyridoxal-phosphate dependent enzyme n=1 Tax=Streptomyces diastatochromogenes TaxID=42236 RepID=UPI00367CF016